MAGHIISLYLQEKGHDVIAFSRRSFQYCQNIIGDAMDITLISKVINDGDFDIIVNCLGILNQDAEEHKHKAVFINSYLPHYLSDFTRDHSTKILHISTDCVFRGDKGAYKEGDFKDGATFYDRSKALGELENSKDLTFRSSIIGPDMNEKGIGLFNWFMKQEGTVLGFKNAIWTGVTTLQLAKVVETAAGLEFKGLYHLVNNTSINKFDLLCLFKNHINKQSVEITPFENNRVDKSLINTRKEYIFKIPSYEQMVIEMTEWISSHKQLYTHYSL